MTGAGPVELQVYVSAPSPPSSAPRTLSDVVLPVTGLGEAAAGVATVGALPAVTVICAVPETVPEVAVTVKGPPGVAPAVKTPPAMAPPPVTVHPNAGCIDSAAP